MDGGAWWATVHGVAKSRTRFHCHFHFSTFMHWRRKWQPTPEFLGFPGCSDGKEFACNAGDLGLIPGLGPPSSGSEYIADCEPIDPEEL